ncbi:hypothetical protein [Polyangium jinanense]|uniref:EGF-like domain-containing protein n=1 Tax=Polyangium jinanense TaxID=2829994 RepID=A0A9X3X4N7_9BACT|nr:hypothetical protein [Polyangium jinanense]MDC3954859.1 hypothetical protein [Polyangium jinanense]MDC3981371.1 hypothetical protein [Polyangium jinanense]
MKRSGSFWTLAGVLFLVTFSAGCGDDSPPTPPTVDAGTDAGGECPPAQHPDGLGGCTSDPCTPNPCTDPLRTQCKDEGGVATCQCDPGHHDESGACVPDTTCTPTTCGGHGSCDTTSGTPVCTCDPGFAGDHCEDCDTQGGYIPDGQGGCTDTPCEPNPCSSDKPACSVEGGMIVCGCGAGTHEENGFCVPDATCMPTTCGGHGTCIDTGSGNLSCTCDPGWAPPNCGTCDDAMGYHPDGAGGCTQDPCLPNPCKDPHQTVCSAPNGMPVCGCDPGYHDEGGTCVVDEVCAPASCSGHGTCSDADGIVVCTCDAGYVGDACADCDTNAGYHPDGMGGCTQDPCLPNPCVEPHETVCTPNGSLAVCSCDPGYHDDGQGGCTDDPCKPNPCLALNQACKNNGGVAECYTPPCDDGNPCTTDTVVNGACTHTTLPNGAACSTTLCLTGQTCQAGTCTGGTTVTCNDANPCTVDTCNALTGCANTVDNTIIPDDGIVCTTDVCQNGAPKHTATNALCNDNLYCTGTESCAPSNPSADANGCIHTNVPVAPPAPGPCASYGACNEATQSFPLIPKPAGSSCNDGIACTQGDTCDAAGLCKGATTASCAGNLDCATTTPMPGGIDVPVGTVSGTITLAGQPLPATSYYAGATFYLKARDTGAQHSVAYFNYSGSGYMLNGPTWTASFLPGVYDLWYRKNWDSQYDTVSATSDGDPNPNGMRILQTNLVLGAGANTLNIDVPRSTVSGNITLGGQPLPSTSYYAGATFYLKAKDTGALHSVAYFNYSGSGYMLNGPTWTASLLPGDYELWYRKNWDSQYDTVTATSIGDPNPNGMRILNKNVTMAPGANTLNIDVPTATVSGNITLGGQPLPATSYYAGATFYLKAKDTGALHSVAYFNYSGSGYMLNGPTWTASLLPGEYELWYRKNYDSQYNTVTATSVGDPNPNGMRILSKSVTIAPGANTLNIDVPTATVSGNITLGGQPLPATSYYAGATFYLKAKDTGALHSVAYFNYSGSGYMLNGPTWTASLLPGDYELWYRKNYDSQYNTVTATSIGDPNPNGMRRLNSNVTITPGANTLNINVPTATVSGTITLEGQPLPATSYYAGATFYLKSKDTGALHSVAYFNYSGSGYVLNGPTWTASLLPGDYELWYRKNYDSQYNTVTATSVGDPNPNGMRILDLDVTITPGSNTLDIDVPMTTVSAPITLAGQPIPPTSYYAGATFYFRAIDTGALHSVAYFNYSGSGYMLNGPTWTASLLPGVYDLLYRKNWDITYDTVTATSVGDPNPNGFRRLGACIAVP